MNVAGDRVDDGCVDIPLGPLLRLRTGLNDHDRKFGYYGTFEHEIVRDHRDDWYPVRKIDLVLMHQLRSLDRQFELSEDERSRN